MNFFLFALEVQVRAREDRNESDLSDYNFLGHITRAHHTSNGSRVESEKCWSPP